MWRLTLVILVFENLRLIHELEANLDYILSAEVDWATELRPYLKKQKQNNKQKKQCKIRFKLKFSLGVPSRMVFLNFFLNQVRNIFYISLCYVSPDKFLGISFIKNNTCRVER